MKITLTSTAFQNGRPIPVRYTCQDANVSPPLRWTGVPAGAKSLALTCEDPDAPAGTWVHWVVYNLPPTTPGLPEDFPPNETLPSGACQGRNDFRRIGYGGPCPPSGAPHRYFFKIYALDAELTRKPGMTKSDLQRSMVGRILAVGDLMGTYQRT